MGHYVRLVVVAASLLSGSGRTLAAAESRNQTKALVSNTHVGATSSTEREDEERSGLTPYLVDQKLRQLKYPVAYAEGFATSFKAFMEYNFVSLSHLFTPPYIIGLRNDFKAQKLPPHYAGLTLYRTLLHNVGGENPVIEAAKIIHDMRDQETKAIADEIEKAQFSVWYDFVNNPDEVISYILQQEHGSISDWKLEVTLRYEIYRKIREYLERGGASTST